ncbi:MAG: MMPL family transporter [Candidatus Wallbacteria bacterium]|nr:MMPL family transporter [Candidatus Wallbacteria bacterium]
MLTDWLTRLSVERPRATLALVAALTVAFGAFLPRVRVDTDPKNMLAETSQVRVGNDRVEERFGLHADVLVLGIVDDSGIFNPASLARIAEVTRRILDVEGVVARDVASLSTTANAVATPEGLSVQPPLARLPANRAEADALRAAVLSNPLFVGRLVSADGTTAAIHVPLRKGANGKQAADRIRAIVEELKMPEKTYLAGDPVARDTFGAEMFRQMGLFSPVAGLVMFVALLAIFRSVAIVTISMSVACISIVWAMGLHIALGYTVHIMSSMMPVFLMAIATDAVHIFNELGFRLLAGAGKRAAILATMEAVGRPVIFSDLTTAAGFAALATGDVPPVRVFGIFVAVGTLAILLLSFTFVPALLALADERRLVAASAGGEPRSRLGGRLLSSLGRLAVRKSSAVFLAGAALLALSVVGMGRIRLNNNMVAWFKPQDAVRVADRVLNERLGGTSTGYLVIRGPNGCFQRPEVLRFLEGLAGGLRKLPNVGKVTSLADAVAQVNAAVNSGREQERRIPGSSETIAQLLFLLGSGGRPADLDELVDYPMSAANVTVQMKSWDADAFEHVVAQAKEFAAHHPPGGLTVEPAGIAYFNLVWNHEVLRGMLTSFASGLLLVWLLLAWEYRSASIGTVAFLPLLFTTAVLYGAVGFLGKDFDMPISVLSTLSLGMAIDFAIHFVSRLSQRLAEPGPHDLDELLVWTVERPGLGIVRNAVVFALGFAVMGLSSLMPYITVGVFMAAIMLLSSVATLLYLPALFKRFPRLLAQRESP